MAEEVTLGEMDLTTVKLRTVRGIATLVSRSFVLQLVATVGFLLLTIFLGRPEIGLFIAINDLVSILGYFSDIGLAASLVQKRDRVSLMDLRTTFTIQQAFVLSLLLLTITLSPWLVSYYHISGAGMWLLYSLLTAFFLASLKTIPSVILERQVKFEIIAAVEVVETVIFYTVAVLLAWRGGGVLSYAWAVILRGVVGTGLIYFLAPWRIGLAWSTASLRSLLSFGLPYQVNTLLATVKDRFINVVLWKIIGPDGVGIIGWAQTWSQKPLRFIMDNVTRVTFPSFSRLQREPVALRQAIEKTLFFITVLTFPVVGLVAVLSPAVVRLIPRWGKWEVALLPLALYCFNSAWAAVSTPLTTVLNAVGKVKINTYLMIMWTGLAWLLTPWLAIKYGFAGVAYSTALIALSSIVPIVIVKRLTHFSLVSSMAKPLVASLVMIVVSLSISQSVSVSLANLLINIALSAAVFLVVIYLLVGPSLIADGQRLLHAFRHPK